jgi:HD superfamily phosphohydrolase
MYFIDALYGKIELDIPPEIIKTPELQRLREIRLCNINSPFITGGTSLNRFEHAIGTAYLAQEITRNLKQDQHDQNSFIVAALLHDIITAPFGHSLEYLYESIKNKEYEHANIWQMIFTGKTIPSSRNFFAEKKSSLHLALGRTTIETIRSIFEMKHPLSKLLINEIDIDNIDNVFRFAYHIGLTFDKKSPLLIAKNLHYENGILFINPEGVSHFEEWFRVRRQLYKYLLEDEGEFMAKALLERAFIECFKDDLISEYDWVLTDAEIVKKILLNKNTIAKNSIQKLMLMDFPTKRNIYFTNDYDIMDKILLKGKINLINYAFTKGVLLHFIRDVKKTCRQLLVKTNDDVGTQKTIGYLDDRYLIGIFSDNISGMRIVEKYLREHLSVDLFDVREKKPDETQTSIFQS